jgi:long-chain fatty acid transport protein
MKFKYIIIFIGVIFFWLSTSNPVFAANGYFLHGYGPVNESLGCTGVAGNTQDVVGSIYRNPANGILFDGNTASIGIGSIYPNVTINSSVDALGASGSSDSMVSYIIGSNTGLVFKNKNSQTAFFLGIIGEAGLHLDIAQSGTNPMFMPQAGKPDNPYGGLFGGFGAVETQLEVVRIPLGMSHQFNGKWAMGFSVSPSIERLRFSPGAFAAPDDANGDGLYTYPDVDDHEFAFGVGFQAGVRYQASKKWGLGLCLTSPTWFEKFEWDVKDELGNHRKIDFQLNRPLSIGMGASYQLMPDTLVLIDLSWINYSNTEGFEKRGFAADGSLAGLGWEDIWVMSVGVQKDIDDLTLRAGYNYGGNPIRAEDTFYNAASLLHSQHHLSFGGSYLICKQAVLDIGYTHVFESAQSGCMCDMNGPVQGTEVETILEYDQISIGVTFPF